MNDDPPGLLDTNVFLHAQTHDEHADECRQFLIALDRGSMHAVLDPMVLHELSYSLRHYVKEITRDETARYLLTVLSWPGVRGEKDLMVETVQRWMSTPGLAFVDAYLATLARSRSAPVYTKNIRDLTRQGATVPNPLPTT